MKCAACGAYVARYRLSEYVSDQPYPSALRRLRCAEAQSPRQTLKNLQQLNFQLPAEFNHVQQIALPCPQTARIDTLIVEAESDYDEESRGETD